MLSVHGESTPSEIPSMSFRRWLVALVAALSVRPALAQTDSSTARDSLASGGVFRGTALRRLPIDDPRQAFTLLPGVVLRNGDIGIATSPDVSIRGGIPGRAGVYIDGAPVRFQTFGVQGIGLAANAIADASVTTGVAPAGVADAGGGVVAYVTRTGGDRLAGQIRWDSDEPFGNGVSVGYNRLEGSVGGPLPIARNLSFFLSTTLQGQRSNYRGLGAASVPTYVPAGVDTVVDVGGAFVALPQIVQWSGECSAGSNAGFECQGLRRPMDWSTARRVQGKVHYTYGAGGASTFSITGLASDLQQRVFPGQAIMDPGLYGGARTWSTIAIVNWRQQLGALRGGPLALDVNLSVGSDHAVSGPLTTASDVATRDPALGIAFETLHFTGLDVFPLPVTDQLVRNVRTNSGQRVPYPNRLDLANGQPYRFNAYGMAFGWPSAGVDGLLTNVSERRLHGRSVLDWRPDGTHRVTFGVDAERTELSVYQSALLRQAFFDAFVEQPTRLGVFASDRLALGSALLDIGLRYDRITPGGEFPNVPGRIYSNPAWGVGADTNDAQYRSNVAALFTRASSKGALSPRIRFAYPVSPGTRVHLGYGRFVEPPNWATYFQLSNSDLDFTGLNGPFGRDVKFATVSQLDFGVRSAVGGDVVLDVAAYYKDLPLYSRRIKPFGDPLNVGDTINVTVVTLQSASHGFGLDARLDWRAGTWLTATTAYSFLRMHTDPTVPDGTTHALAAAIAVRVPADWGGGSFVGTLVRDVGVDGTLRATSGLPYTRLINIGSGTLAPGPLGPGGPAEPINTSRLPWTKRFDLRITKTVQAGGRAWTVYADLRNVLNFRNTLALFGETGGVVNDQHRAVALSAEYLNLKSEAQGNGALEPDGATVNLTGCSTWANSANCVALMRVERRFGDGNGLYTLAEQDRALNAYYDAFFGPSQFYGSGRTLRFGVELEL
jgi:hypothetical protein